MAKSKTVCLFQQLLSKSPEEKLSAQVQLDVQKAKSKFEIAIAETKCTLAQTQQAYENLRGSKNVDPVSLVGYRQDITNLTNGLAVLEEEYNELFVNPVVE